MVNIVTDLTQQAQVGLVRPARRSEIDPSTLAATWTTDFSKGSGLDGVIKAQEKHFLPSLDGPPTEVSMDWPTAVAVHIGRQTRFYALQFLMWHGVVNDVVGGVPIVVSYDPISDSAEAFDRRVGDRTYTFAVSGFLRNGNALLYDVETESWWQQLTGQAVTGTLAGAQLEPVEFQVVSNAVARKLAVEAPENVDTMAPPREDFPYARNLYLHYDVPDGKPIFTLARPDARLRPLQRVAVIEAEGERFAVPFPDAAHHDNFAGTITVGGKQVVLFFDASTQSELDARLVTNSRAVGSLAAFETQGTAVWSADLRSDWFVDGSGSRWDMLGEAMDGPAKGTRLTPLMHHAAFWFSVAAIFPGIQLRSLDDRK